MTHSVLTCPAELMVHLGLDFISGAELLILWAAKQKHGKLGVFYCGGMVFMSQSVLTHLADTWSSFLIWVGLVTHFGLLVSW